VTIGNISQAVRCDLHTAETQVQSQLISGWNCDEVALGQVSV
jgi:hypothetical protein